MHPGLILAADEGGGAALDQVFLMTAIAGVISAGLGLIAYLHRTRRITWLQTFAEFAGRLFRRPPWVALPSLLFTTTIITAMFGFIWDVSLHIGRGRDSGPLANPAHYFILFGLFFLFIGGVLAMILPREEPGTPPGSQSGRVPVKITRTWYAPTGGILIATAGLYALIGFPLDDIWHRIFGQDVTLWGPTHLMLIGGAGLSLLAIIILDWEGAAAPKLHRDDAGDLVGEDGRPPGRGSFMVWFGRAMMAAGLVIGMSVYQVEFDFGVQQFRAVFHPTLMLAAGAFALVVARLLAGRGAAVFAVLAAAIIREVIAWIVWVPAEAPFSIFPLYLGIAIIVEVLAFTPLLQRRLLFGAVAGLLAGTLGFFLERIWVNAVFPIGWNTGFTVEALLMAVPAATISGLVAALFVVAVRGEPLPRPAIRRSIMVVFVAVAAIVTANGLTYHTPDLTATLTFADAAADDGNTMRTATIELSREIPDDAEWVQLMAWQGGESELRGLHIDTLRKVGPTTYETTEPFPVGGSWKTLLRVQNGKEMGAVPVYLPADPGIGATEVIAQPGTAYPFEQELSILQRERKADASALAFGMASLVVLACTLAFIWLLCWGAVRVNAARREQLAEVDATPGAAPAPRAPERPTTGTSR